MLTSLQQRQDAVAHLQGRQHQRQRRVVEVVAGEPANVLIELLQRGRADVGRLGPLAELGRLAGRVDDDSSSVGTLPGEPASRRSRRCLRAASAVTGAAGSSVTAMSGWSGSGGGTGRGTRPDKLASAPRGSSGCCPDSAGGWVGTGWRWARPGGSALLDAADPLVAEGDVV